MKRDELCEVLRREYRPGVDGGVMKTSDPEYRNIWFVVPPVPPEKPPANLPFQELSRAHNIISGLTSFDNLSPLERMISRLLLRNEAVSSSRMEGTWSTIDHVLTPEDELEKLDEQHSAHKAVRGYAHALENNFSKVQKNGLDSLNTELICELHKNIMEKDPNYKGEPGKIRRVGDEGSVVFIGGLGRKENSTYNPTPPEEVARTLEEVMQWYRNDVIVEMGDAGMGLSLPIRLAIGHSHFEAVHPFRDGNGRVGRMIWPLQMILANKQPLYLSGFVEAYKDDYGRALEKAQKKLQYGPIIEFVCEAIVRSHRETQTTINYLSVLPNKWKKQGKFRSGSAAEKLMDQILYAPILNTQEVINRTGVSFRAASRALKNLEEAGVLKERTGFSRNRIFAAEEVIAILGRAFGEKPIG